MSLVLIADQDKGLRLELTKVLEKSGHSVLHAESAQQTLDEAQDQDPDLILLAIDLPDKPVLQLLEELRAETNLARTPIMVMSNEADHEMLSKTFRWDIVDFVQKPLNMQILIAKIGAHTRLNLAYKFSRRLSKEMFMSRIERLETQMTANEDDISEAQRHFTWMQPKPPEVEGYSLEVSFKPFDRLGGDFYDFLWLDRDLLAVVVGDVSGHGIQAAILQVMARKLINLALRQENGNLKKAVEFANRELTNDLPPGSFVAAAMGVLNVRTHEWRHVRCGIPYPLLLKGKKSESLVTPGGPLGLSTKPDWHAQVGEYSSVLERDQGMMLMSDGIIEAYVDKENDEQFEVEGVQKAIAECPEDSTIVQAVYDAADLDITTDDDCTMIVLRRT